MASSIASAKARSFAWRSSTAEAGANVEFDKVLLVGQGDSVKIGAPFLSGGKVVATVQSHGKGDKVTHRQIPPPQALPAAGHAPSALYGTEGHEHRRLRPAARHSI